jgi:hypothetical protein
LVAEVGPDGKGEEAEEERRGGEEVVESVMALYDSS